MIAGAVVGVIAAAALVAAIGYVVRKRQQESLAAAAVAANPQVAVMPMQMQMPMPMHTGGMDASGHEHELWYPAAAALQDVKVCV